MNIIKIGSIFRAKGVQKTRTLRLIAGFWQLSEGQLFIMGKPMANIPPSDQPVNIVFEDNALFPHQIKFQYSNKENISVFRTDAKPRLGW
jgi:ABC-type sugar transport system ATPase subunit